MKPYGAPWIIEHNTTPYGPMAVSINSESSFRVSSYYSRFQFQGVCRIRAPPFSGLY